MSAVVVTGLGVVSALGLGKDQFWSGLVSGRNGIDTITSFDPSDYSTRFAAQVQDFDATQYVSKKEVRRMDRVVQFSVAAARMALDDAKLTVTQDNSDNIGVLIGSGIGGMHTFEEQCRASIEQGPSRVSPLFIPMMVPNMPSGQVAIQLGLRGPNFGVVSACASGTHAIGLATSLLQAGKAEVIVTGGAEASITPLCIAGFCAMRALSARNDDPHHASRPFDAQRDGFVVGEGSAVLVLETLEHAQKRGAHIYATVAGFGSTADAYHITAPDPSGVGAARAMRLALADAGMQPTDIDYINAHGTSTPLGDPTEVKAINSVFGEHASKLCVSSTKSMTGHALGAAGALETAACVLATQNDLVPPTINYEYPDPECNLDVVPNVARKTVVRAALNNSFGFGGQNAVVVIKKYM